MSELSRERLFGETLPEPWRPLVALLDELNRLTHDPKEGGEPALDALRARAAALRARVIDTATHFTEDMPETLRSSSPEYKRWFSEAVLLWSCFADAGGEVLVDTIATRTLAAYPLDFPKSEGGLAAMRRALIAVFSWSEVEMMAIEAKVHGLTANLRLKRAITRALALHLSTDDARERDRRSVDLMRAIYGDVPWQPGDVDVVLTSTALFLCLHYDGTVLLAPGFAERPPVERGRIADFLKRVHDEQQSLKSVRFPAFGIFDAELVKPSLLTSIVDSVRSDAELSTTAESVVADTLATMVTVLPTQDVEKFLVHDVWGHGWQQTLCEFEWKFSQLAAIGEPLGLPTGARFAASGLGLAGAFAVRDGHSNLVPDVLLSVVDSDLRERIAVGMNLVVAESLADLIEHKFARYGFPLPSSSLLSGSPLRLDLSLADTTLMVRAWRRPYRNLLGHPAERERLRADLVRSGVEDRGLLQAIEQAVDLIGTHFGVAFEDEVRSVSDVAALRVNVLERIMLGVMTFDAALDRLLAEGDVRWKRLRAEGATDRWRCPPACIDLIAVLIAWFYEQEPELHVWHLDELASSELGPMLLRLEQTLAQDTFR